MGWKDILRPIRDGLRDNLPHRQTAPSRDHERERLRKRHEDALRGFAYYESFDEVEHWSSQDVDPLQRANTPLLHRSSGSGRSGAAVGNVSNITIIHDYSGNYHEYESSQQNVVDILRYGCEYMQSIDRFVYFSHKLVCIPPPTWTNALHRNGVKSFGTFLVEPQTAGIARILEQVDGQPDYVFARKLAQMATEYGFDGWLINIEKTFPALRWGEKHLTGFLNCLQSALGSGSVIWYDALTSNNTIGYQNGLTALNLPFAKAAGSILTNYAWTPEKAILAKELAEQNSIPLSNLIFGIDVWAQNVGSEEHSRKTWPIDGGGGTGTGLGVAALAEHGLSTGIFAPAWPYEHFSEHQKAIERSMWTGDTLPLDMECDCVPKNPHYIGSYMNHSISDSAAKHCAGSDSFFHTDFEQAFTKRDDRTWAQVGYQSVLPQRESGAHPPSVVMKLSDSPACWTLCLDTGKILDCGFRLGPNGKTHVEGFSVKLYDLDISWASSLAAKLKYRNCAALSAPKLSICFQGDDFSFSMPLTATTVTTVNFMLPIFPDGFTDLKHARLTGITIRVDGLDACKQRSGTIQLLQIFEISIQKAEQQHGRYSIRDVCLEKKEEHGVTHKRLTWAYNVDEPAETKGMPYGTITGPFSYFLLKVNGEILGRAYALEFVIDERISQILESNGESTVTISGVGYDGRLVASHMCTARDIGPGRDSWQMVEAHNRFDE